MKLANFYFKCTCGKYARFNNTDDLKGCARCKRILRIPTIFIKYLEEQKNEGENIPTNE